MAKKKTTVAKKKTTRRKPAAETGENETVALKSATDGEAPTAAATPAKSRSAGAGRARRPRRSAKSAAVEASTTTAPETIVAVEPAAPEPPPFLIDESPDADTARIQTATTSDASHAETPPATGGRRRRRRRSKPRRPGDTRPDSELPETARKPGRTAPLPQDIVTPRAPGARVEKRDDAIVIRFPEPENAAAPKAQPPDRATGAPPKEMSAFVAEPTRTTPVARDLPPRETADFDSTNFLLESEDVESVSDLDDRAPAAREPSRPVEEPREYESAEDFTEKPLWSSTHERDDVGPLEEIEEIETIETVERRAPETREGDAPAEPEREGQPGRRRKKRGRRGRRREEERPEAVEIGGEEEPHTRPLGKQEMIINVVPHEECRIAIMEEGKLQEINLERASSENYVGNIYKGIITNVEPSIQAAFIDFGQGKNGFLHISDLHPQYFPNGEGNTENVGRKMPRRNRPPIQRCLRRGQQLLVQITKEGIGTKGPTLTTYLSIPGRFLVMMPGMRQLGVSRKIEDEEARRVLRGLLGQLELPDDSGFIARTAALERTVRELQSDLNYLARLWKTVERRIGSLKAPAELYTESDLVIRTIRDVYTEEIARIVVDDADVAKRAREFLSIFSPHSRDIVVHYEEPEPIFHRYGIEEELERLHSRHVPLKSGGSLVIDQTEALVAIDVNSGRFRTEDDAETTAYKMDMEAADEIPRQLRLRDLGGVIICDFIDVRMERHKREIEHRLINNLKKHKERAKVLRMSEFGLIELTRQRQRASLTRNVYRDCAHCHGTGMVKTPESVALDAMRTIQFAASKENIRTIELFVSAEVSDLLLNRKRGALYELETKNHRKISIRMNAAFTLDEIQLKCYDQRGRLIPSP